MIKVEGTGLREDREGVARSEVVKKKTKQIEGLHHREIRSYGFSYCTQTNDSKDHHSLWILGWIC